MDFAFCLNKIGGTELNSKHTVFITRIIEIATSLKLLPTLVEDDDLLLLFCNFDTEPSRSKLSFDDLNNYQCRNLFRFDKHDISTLRDALGIPEKIVC